MIRSEALRSLRVSTEFDQMRKIDENPWQADLFEFVIHVLPIGGGETDAYSMNALLSSVTVSLLSDVVAITSRGLTPSRHSHRVLVFFN